MIGYEADAGGDVRVRGYRDDGSVWLHIGQEQARKVDVEQLKDALDLAQLWIKNQTDPNTAPHTPWPHVH